VLWNDLKPPYKIVSGRLLRMGPPAEGVASPVVVGTQGEGPEVQGRQGRAPVAGSDASSAKPDMPVKPVKPVKASPKVDEVRPRKADVNPSKAAGDAGGRATLRWHWPLPGPVRQTFVRGDRTRAGIRIAGRSGDQVRAAEAGSVVYSGSGLKGYGNLIIIQHNKDFLSAYGFNRRLLVQEGARVKRGQAVAEIGQAAGGDWLLHFEIRKNGNAVDPLGYLPSTR
jgi:lipoprotein NlpD